MRKGEQTRQEIIRKAAPLFNRKGFEGASLSDLMRATGLEKGGIYRHFSSKEELAAEAFDYAWDVARSLRLQDTDEISNTVDRLRQVIRNFRDRREGLVPGGCPLLNAAIDSDNGNEHVRERVKRALRGWLDYAEGLLVEGQARGEVSATVNPRETATLIVSTLEGAVMICRVQKNDDALNVAIRHLEEYLEASVRPTAPAKLARKRR